jgi:hypothetical protein
MDHRAYFQIDDQEDEHKIQEEAMLMLCRNAFPRLFRCSSKPWRRIPPE